MLIYIFLEFKVTKNKDILYTIMYLDMRKLTRVKEKKT